GRARSGEARDRVDRPRRRVQSRTTMIEQAPAVPAEADAAGHSPDEVVTRAPLPLAGIRDRAAQSVRSIAASLRQGGRTVARAWGRSLQLRVAVTTLVISGVVVLIVGIFLVDQISGGVLRAKRSAAIAQVDTAMASARVALGETNFADVQGVANAVSNLKSELALRGNDAGLYRVLIKSDVSGVQLEALCD